MKRLSGGIVLAISCLVCALLIVRAREDLELEDGYSLAIFVFGFAIVAASTAGIAWGAYRIAARWNARRNGKPIGQASAVVLCWCLALGVLAAAPLTGGWDDGCNGHGGAFPVAAVPFLATAPERWAPTYLSTTTLIACGDRKNHEGSFELW